MTNHAGFVLGLWVICCLYKPTPIFATINPPYTCTTATTVCEPGRETGIEVQTPPDNGTLSSQGRPGKRGPEGHRGEKGDKGDPCQCDVADEETMANMTRRMEKLEAVNAELRKVQSGYGELGSVSNPGRSCIHLKEEGQTVSGIYSIQIDRRSSMIQVYCDMESDEGGWTLVASVHENNIDGKCTPGDLWSSEQGAAKASKATGSGNWQNFNVFGAPEAATSADYKSQAYYSLPGSDVMIWHVPNGVDIDSASEKAFLKYYTNTSFLNEYGESLQSLFHNYFPLKKGKIEFKPENIAGIISDLRTQSTSMRGGIPDFYSYVYDGSVNNEIDDGGNDMYDEGNKISYRIGKNTETHAMYNEHYRNTSHGVEFISSSSQHPFHALMWISNEERTEQSYAIRVHGDAGADNDGNSTFRRGSLSHEGYSLTYHAYSIYGAESDPSICEVFYYIQSDLWGSEVPTVTRSPWSSGTDALDHALVFEGAPRSLLVGYTLLSRTEGLEVTNGHIRSVLNKILKRIPSQTDKTMCNPEEEILIQPIIYLKGNTTQVSAGIPPSVQSRTSAGFIQFRVYNDDGFPNAICPGVKTSSCRPESVCIGGINTRPTDERACGDFAGWQGDSGNSPNETSPSGAAKSLNDVNSSILIFTRK